MNEDILKELRELRQHVRASGIAINFGVGVQIGLLIIISYHLYKLNEKN